ncbi:hypothetical protein ID866_5871 [Astraeus odoratus]|nr:hypothetical protein ID866_5871 [Astraeus odoratus]
MACIGAITLAASAMYFAAGDSKAKEGPDSVYRPQLQADQSDAKYHSPELREKLHESPLSTKGK